MREGWGGGRKESGKWVVVVREGGGRGEGLDKGHNIPLVWRKPRSEATDSIPYLTQVGVKQPTVRGMHLAIDMYGCLN